MYLRWQRDERRVVIIDGARKPSATTPAGRLLPASCPSIRQEAHARALSPPPEL
jgi:hypothetical protein